MLKAPPRPLSERLLSAAALVTGLALGLPVLTIIVLALISRNPQWIRVNMPASLGKPFYPGT